MNRSRKFEHLEARQLCHADVNWDGQVTAADALEVINHLTSEQQITITRVHPLDVNFDRRITPLDALLIINRLDDNPRHRIAVRLGDVRSGELTPDEVRWAIEEAFWRFEEVASVDFYVSDGAADLVVASRQIVIGGYHYRGQQTGDTVWFHNSEPGLRMFPSVHGVTQILVHEFGHWLGFDHTGDRSCVMHPHAPAGFCQAELDALWARFGRSENFLH